MFLCINFKFKNYKFKFLFIHKFQHKLWKTFLPIFNIWKIKINNHYLIFKFLIIFYNHPVYLNDLPSHCPEGVSEGQCSLYHCSIYVYYFGVRYTLNNPWAVPCSWPLYYVITSHWTITLQYNHLYINLLFVFDKIPFILFGHCMSNINIHCSPWWHNWIIIITYI